MWSLAVVVLLLGAVGGEVVSFSNCPVSGKAAVVACADYYCPHGTKR
jgi:hypothetical protein